MSSDNLNSSIRHQSVTARARPGDEPPGTGVPEAATMNTHSTLHAAILSRRAVDSLDAIIPATRDNHGTSGGGADDQSGDRHPDGECDQRKHCDGKDGSRKQMMGNEPSCGNLDEMSGGGHLEKPVPKAATASGCSKATDPRVMKVSGASTAMERKEVEGIRGATNPRTRTSTI